MGGFPDRAQFQARCGFSMSGAGAKASVAGGGCFRLSFGWGGKRPLAERQKGTRKRAYKGCRGGAESAYSRRSAFSHPVLSDNGDLRSGLKDQRGSAFARPRASPLEGRKWTLGLLPQSGENCHRTGLNSSIPKAIGGSGLLAQGFRTGRPRREANFKGEPLPAKERRSDPSCVIHVGQTKRRQGGGRLQRFPCHLGRPGQQLPGSRVPHPLRHRRAGITHGVDGDDIRMVERPVAGRLPFQEHPEYHRTPSPDCGGKCRTPIAPAPCDYGAARLEA